MNTSKRLTTKKTSQGRKGTKWTVIGQWGMSSTKRLSKLDQGKRWTSTPGSTQAKTMWKPKQTPQASFDDDYYDDDYFDEFHDYVSDDDDYYDERDLWDEDYSGYVDSYSDEYGDGDYYYLEDYNQFDDFGDYDFYDEDCIYRFENSVRYKKGNYDVCDGHSYDDDDNYRYGKGYSEDYDDADEYYDEDDRFYDEFYNGYDDNGDNDDDY